MSKMVPKSMILLMQVRLCHRWLKLIKTNLWIMLGKERRKGIFRRLISLNCSPSSIRIVVRWRVTLLSIKIVIWLTVPTCIIRITHWLHGVRLRTRRLAKVTRRHFSGLIGLSLLSLRLITNLKSQSPLTILFLLHHRPNERKGKKKESPYLIYLTLRNKKKCK